MTRTILTPDLMTAYDNRARSLRSEAFIGLIRALFSRNGKTVTGEHGAAANAPGVATGHRAAA
ncbi:hypothetical protein E1178_07850 [Roseibium hamelinense]|uniref:hypothetical protein n=1 Tax=Roseibium hamelinense TaxID=150831 RepID=UPI0011A8D38C|nr:hypothetical protein [Roseibium hamelinense]MTI43521.1 hypothetical protein [Roseibium hamelinense]